MLISMPRVEQKHQGGLVQTQVVDHRPHHPGQRVGFWGGLLMALSAVACIMIPGVRRFEDMTGVILVLSVAAVGAVMLLLSGRPTIETIPLASLDLDHGRMKIYQEASSVIPPEGRELWFDEVRHVVFGMTRYPMDERKPDIRVEAFTVCLEMMDGAVLPVIEASPEKLASYKVATWLSEATRAPVLQAGLGV